MRIFLDTNVLASAFGTRGLCADVLQLIVSEHELLTGEVVIEELTRALSRKFGMPAEIVKGYENFLRGGYHVEPRPRQLPNLNLSEHGDLMVVGSAINAKAEIVITGDREMLALNKPEGLRIVSPREFWNLTSRTKRRTK